MSVFTKLKIQPASSDYSKFNMSNDVMMTSDFGQLNPIRIDEHIIGDKVKVEVSHFNRTAPMIDPAFADVGMRLSAIWVPYYTIADDADAYIAGLTEFGGQIATGRYIYQRDLDSLFWGTCNGSTEEKGNSDYLRNATRDEIDYVLQLIDHRESIPRRFFVRYNSTDVASEPYIYVMNYHGKCLYKVLRGLGYDISQTYSYLPSAQQPTVNYSLVLNAYPFLCYLKAYADIFMPSAFYQGSSLLLALRLIKTKGYDSIVDQEGYITLDALQHIAREFFDVFYDSDYFTTAWQSTSSPLSSSMASVDTFKDSNHSTNIYASSQSDTALDLSTRTTLGTVLTQQQLNFLRGFDDFVRRNNLTGYREFNSVYAKFGIKPSELRSNYCQLIQSRNFQLQIGDVTSTASGDGTDLGAFAGKAFMSGNMSFDFECKDYGMLVFISQLYVKPIYFQGIRKTCLRKDCFDFYQPQFDGVGSAPISHNELGSFYGDSVFGFTERYNDYRFKLSDIFGDFALDEDMYSWHAGRVFSQYNKPVAQSSNMIVYDYDDAGNSQYDRLFSTYNVDNPFDHFFQVFHFDVSKLSKMKNNSAAFGLGVGGVEIDRNGSV